MNHTDPTYSWSYPWYDFVVCKQGWYGHTTIQSALNAVTEDYQIILVESGTYAENITLPAYKVLLISSNGAAVTTISGISAGSVIEVSSDSVINGFTITGSNGFQSAESGTGGGIFIQDCSPRITACVLSGNSASDGAAIYSNGGAPTLQNCTIINNSSDDGAAISVVSGTLTATDSIFWNPSVQGELSGTGVALSYCDIRGGLTGTGNINIDPILRADGHLTAGSPCIAAGNGVCVRDMNGKITSDYPTTADIGADQWIDSLNCGLPDWWRNQYFGYYWWPFDPASVVRWDGLTMLNAYIQGADPTRYYSGKPPDLTVVGGDQQYGIPNQLAASPLAVKVSYGSLGLVNAPVHFSIGNGQQGLSAQPGGQPASSITVNTGTDGIATAYLTFPAPELGDVHVLATPGGPEILSGTAEFTEHYLAIPAAPTGLTASVQNGGVKLDWINNSTFMADFAVERSDNGASTWNQIATVLSNSTSFTDSTPMSGMFFIYRVRAENAAGQSEPSNVVSEYGTDPETSDQDGDGMPDAWELRNGLNPDDPSDANEDLDRDGYPNIYEFIHSTNPQSAVSQPKANVIVDQSSADGTFPSIQAGIDACPEHGIVMVNPGTYSENLTISGDNVLIISASGAAVTVITVSNDSILNGFRITSGSGVQTGESGTGGGVLIQGGSPRLVNCVIACNSAALGAAVYSDAVAPVLLNCTVVSNTSTGGAAVVANSGTVQIRNSILWNPNCQQESSGTGISACYSDIQNFTTSGTTTNIAADPILTADYHLSPSSPCIHHGNPALASGMDMDGDPRSADHCDIGADEYGVPQSWQLQNFGHVGIDPNGDPLGDGLTNWQAWHLGIDPNQLWSPPDNDPDSFPVITILSPVGVVLTDPNSP